MDASARSLLVSGLVALAGVVTLDLAYGAYARRHFVPDTTLRVAEAQGDGCVVTLGDSRMAAGIDPASLADGLAKGGAHRCVATLGIGAVGVPGAAMAIRRFVADGRRPSVVVLGESAGTLLPELRTTDPSELVGNRAVEIEWSIAPDVERYYPGFPFVELDRGIRFSLARTNALQTYESATWAKVNDLQTRIAADRPAEPRNRFGSLADMRKLLATFRTDAEAELEHFDGHWKTSAWFDVLRDVTHECGARLVVIEVPMHSTYREDVLETPVASRYRQWLRSELARSGDIFVDVSSPRSVSDDDFGDGLHLDSEGSRRFSAELGGDLARVLGPER